MVGMSFRFVFVIRVQLFQPDRPEFQQIFQTLHWVGGGPPRQLFNGDGGPRSVDLIQPPCESVLFPAVLVACPALGRGVPQQPPAIHVLARLEMAAFQRPPMLLFPTCETTNHPHGVGPRLPDV